MITQIPKSFGSKHTRLLRGAAQDFTQQTYRPIKILSGKGVYVLVTLFYGTKRHYIKSSAVKRGTEK
jgi:hypothetical protein